MDEMFSDIGDLVFSLFIGYVGALELLFVARHLYHLSCQHPSDSETDAESLQRLQEKMRRELADAKAREQRTGANTMQDGVAYKDGFRIEPQRTGNEENDAKAKAKEQRRAELEAELARQKKIEEETRKQLEQAEAELARQRAQAAAEEAENLQKLLEIERERENEQRKLEAEEAKRHEAEEKARERERQRLEAEAEAAQELQLLALERQREEEQRRLEKQEQELQAEHERERHPGNLSERLLAAERQRELEEAEDDDDGYGDPELVTSTASTPIQRDKRAQKQKLIEENARKFLEAEQEMIALQEKMLESIQEPLGSTTPEINEPIIQRSHQYSNAAAPQSSLAATNTVKTQFGQGSSESFTLTSKPLLFPGVSDDASSNEPNSSNKSSFSTQPSEEIATTTGTDDASKTQTIGLQLPQHERQDPDGEDNSTPSVQYTEDYLRSLDGIKLRPLVREDGSGRRRAFKKRRSSGSSNSSRDSRTSREEELKMFTSLEEEELQNVQKGGDGDFTPIKYTNEPTLKVKGHHHRRHKRSPAQDSGKSGDELRTSLEMLGEEGSNPWGEVVPEHYKNTEFWRREKAMSIDEEEIEFERPLLGRETNINAANNKPNSSSFEEATQLQNTEAMIALQQQRSKEDEIDVTQDNDDTKAAASSSPTQNETTNLQTSHKTDRSRTSPSSPARSSASPRLRRSPRIDEMDQYEERWRESEVAATAESNTQTQSQLNTPTISIQSAGDTAPWRDEYGLIMQGLSDFYDFTASVNPSRSRSTSRNASPVSTPLPRDVAYEFTVLTQSGDASSDDPPKPTTTVTIHDVYDDTGNFQESENSRETIVAFIKSLNVEKEYDNSEEKMSTESEPTVLENTTDTVDNGVDNNTRAEMNNLVESLRAACTATSRSRSKSPLPTMENIQRSLDQRRSKLIKHNDEIFEKLATHNETEQPMITANADNICSIKSESGKRDEELQDFATAEMNQLVASLRADRIRSRSRSRSPLPTTVNIERSLEMRRHKLIQHNDEIYATQIAPKVGSEMSVQATPSITIETAEEDTTENAPPSADDAETESPEAMRALVASLRIARSRSRSKSPMRIPTAKNLDESISVRREKLIARNDQVNEHFLERAKSPEPPRCVVEYVYEFEEASVERNERSRSPSRSRSQSPQFDEDFHRMLNLESSQNRTLRKSSEEFETLLAAKQRQLDEEALYQLKNACEETELRTLTPTDEEALRDTIEIEKEETDQLAELPAKERLRKLRSSPTTPDYERTISEEWRDVQRIKQERIASGFKRSTYVGESLELGSEYEKLRREAAHFQRSNSPSPSSHGGSVVEELTDKARQNAADKRLVQEHILAELFAQSSISGEVQVDEDRHGAKPKREHSTSLSNSGLDCTIADTDAPYDSTPQFDEMRREMAVFQRSRSCSRSPIDERSAASIEITNIEIEATRRQLHDQLLDKISSATISFQDFSRHLNADFLDDRRASDSALMQKSDAMIQYRNEYIDQDYDVEPEEYHHYRRFSLNQEQPTEEYPEDEDGYVYISEIELHSLTSDASNWLEHGEDYGNYSDEMENEKVELEYEERTENITVDMAEPAEDFEILREEDETDGSEDERQTVVEVDDEIDTDICDFNERGPADESHHEQSECEEADRAMDLYANREANDWQAIGDEVNDILNHENHCDNDEEEEGAVGGVDSDSFTIDQIYDEAIKNRKQSGILREYDSILLEMQKSFERSEDQSNDDLSDSERYALWAKTRALERSGGISGIPSSSSSTLSFIEAEKRDSEMRYLGDAGMTARQSTRLRSRYGYVPVLQGGGSENVDNVDLNYKPRREYNWRKNFKLDDGDGDGDGEQSLPENGTETYGNDDSNGYFDGRKYSLGGESITLFSRSPEREVLEPVPAEEDEEIYKNQLEGEGVIDIIDCENKENAPKSKTKKKSKKKTHRESKEILERRLSKDEDDSDNQLYSRRSSSLQMETEDSPKRKSRSRRSSKSSTTNEDSSSLFSPRSSVGIVDATPAELANEPVKKKLKKRKKAKDSFATTAQDIKEEQASELIAIAEAHPEPMPMTAVSTTISPKSASLDMLVTLSPANSVCVTPASTESETATASIQHKTACTTVPVSKTTTTITSAISTAKVPATTSNPTSTTSTTSTTASSSNVIDTFDILKDANFYPLF